MTVYVLRPVGPADAAAWARLREALWEGDDHAVEIAQYFAGTLGEPQEVLLAIAPSGEAVGHVELSIREDVPGLDGIVVGYIEGLYIAPGHRTPALLRRLLRASEDWARAQGCRAFASDREDRVIVHARFVDPATAGDAASASRAT